MRLYFSPGSCALASHIALEESGLAYEAVRIDVRNGENQGAAYLAKNPWGRVPALEVDGAFLAETGAILPYIADRAPERGLLPAPGTWERAKAQEMFGVLASSVHPAFRSMFRPGRQVATPEGERDLLAVGLRNLTSILGQVDQQIAGRAYVLGDRFSLCDAHLFVMALWRHRSAVAGKLPPLPNIDALEARVRERTSVQKVLPLYT